MSLKDIDLKKSYYSLIDSVVKDFYVPVLHESVLYQRAVGFFSSSALSLLTVGICDLINNGGKIQLVASPKLSAEDINAINVGIKKKEEIVEEALLREFRPVQGSFEEERLNLLSNLIAANKLEIKIAILENDNGIGIFHVKYGIMEDIKGNSIVFSGSMNESYNAFEQNYEAIDVFSSWTQDSDRVEEKKIGFKAIWNDSERGIHVFRFPKVDEAFIKNYKKDDIIDLTLDKKWLEQVAKKIKTKPKMGIGEDTTTYSFNRVFEPKIPQNVTIREYQLAAIDGWREKKYRGIFDMATGTGKTYTALAAIAHLFQRNNGRLAVIIVCPYQHLVEQWVGDIKEFGMKPIICYSASKQKNWFERLKEAVISFDVAAMNHFCMITTNATFSSKRVQEQVKKLKTDTLLIVDEAHNFGAINLKSTLLESASFRLALSATLDRHGDEEGTKALYEYFGEKCIEYGLKEAIENNMLTPYKYYPVPVYLTEAELKEYLDLSSKIKKNMHFGKKEKGSLSEYVKMLLIKRARVVAGAFNKVEKLKNILISNCYLNDSHILIYCGATTFHDSDYIEGKDDEQEIRQIDAVRRMLANDLNMKVAKFTSQEDAQTREIIKDDFSNGDELQAIVAIKCLDEGVNIPSIKTAFILASSTNPKEYIQRRGRVLRKYKGKKFATIYDFITLPLPLENIDDYDDEDIASARALARKEFVRMDDFSALAMNPSDSDLLKFDIQDAYRLYEDNNGEVSEYE